MASIATQKNGSRRIQFVGHDKKRKTLRLGKVPKKAADIVKRQV